MCNLLLARLARLAPLARLARLASLAWLAWLARLAQLGWAGWLPRLARQPAHAKVNNKKKDETMHELFNGIFYTQEGKYILTLYFHYTSILIALAHALIVLALLNSIKKLRQLSWHLLELECY